MLPKLKCCGGNVRHLPHCAYAKCHDEKIELLAELNNLKKTLAIYQNDLHNTRKQYNTELANQALLYTRINKLKDGISDAIEYIKDPSNNLYIPIIYTLIDKLSRLTVI